MQGAVKDRESRLIKRICWFFSLSFLMACPIAAWYTGEWGQVLPGFFRILVTPCPLVTDYFALGNLAAALLNAGLCGAACAGFMEALRAECHANTLAGFFLVVGHCFYGLNFLNMWPPMLSIYLFCRMMRIDFRDNLSMAMFATAFGPFVSELLFRYPFGERYQYGQFAVSGDGILLVLLLVLFLAVTIPAMLPGARRMHKGYNLYNGGLAFGFLGLFLYAFMYPTMGRTAPENLELTVGTSYEAFILAFFLVVFGGCLAVGWALDGRSFRGYEALLQDDGHHSDFIQQYGTPCVMINLGFYGLMMTAYFGLVIFLTEGAGYTGATMGVTLAAMSFVAAGQHPRNVWPVLAGYLVLSLFVTGLCMLRGEAAPWTLSTQGYLNGAAFATGLCPLAGRYGWKVGMLAGIICAVMCTSTAMIHGGFILYNGGLTAGITALIVEPCLEFYYKEKKGC